MSKPFNQFGKPGKGQQPRPGNQAQNQRKRGRESREKMQPSVKRVVSDSQPALHFAQKLHSTTFGKQTYDVMILRVAQGGALVSNVKPLIVYQAQHGFDVGYEGTGAKDFALNILHLLCHPSDPTVPVCGVHVSRVAWHAHEDFAREVLAPLDLLPGEYTTITEPFLRGWISRNRSRWERIDFSPTGGSEVK